MRFAEAKIHMFLKSSIFPVILAIVQVQNLAFGRGGGSLYIYIYMHAKVLTQTRPSARYASFTVAEATQELNRFVSQTQPPAASSHAHPPLKYPDVK